MQEVIKLCPKNIQLMVHRAIPAPHTPPNKKKNFAPTLKLKKKKYIYI